MHPPLGYIKPPEPSFATRTALSTLTHSPPLSTTSLHPPGWRELCCFPPRPRRPSSSCSATIEVDEGHAATLAFSSCPLTSLFPPAPVAHPRLFSSCSGSTRGARQQGDCPELGTELQPTTRNSPARTTPPVGPVKPPPPSAPSPPSPGTLGEPPRARLRRLPSDRHRFLVAGDAAVTGRWI